MSHSTNNKFLAALIPSAIILTGLIVLFSTSHKPENTEQPLTRTYPIMGTWAQISLYGDPKTTNEAFIRIQNAFNQVNNHCSRFIPKSELSKLNASAYDRPFKCSKLLWNALQQSNFFYKMTDGAFDITITPLMKLWGFYRKQNKIPSKQEISVALTKVGMNKVKFNSKNKTVSFSIKGITLDLGGIAKGYAVDLAYDSIKDLNIKSGIINLGGNIRTLQEPPPGKKHYIIGVRDPFDKSEIMNGAVKVNNEALATSGDYEQFVVIDGKRFTHIINPLTGYPIKDMAASTIICKNATWADALSTSVFLKGRNFAEKLHQKYPDINILIVKGYESQPDTIKVFKFGKVWQQIEEPEQ